MEHSSTQATANARRQLEKMDRAALAELQLAKLNALLADILPTNRFYAKKFGALRLPIASLEDFFELPFTTKEELFGGEGGAANLTWPLQAYSRYHETSGTHGQPLAVYDTVDDWQWWIDSWQFVLDAAEITAEDRAVLAFSFGPFIGFWSARDALAARGALVIPGGGMSSRARLALIERTNATALFCTPTYAMHLADVASEHGVELADSAVRSIVVAGEPGGSIPSVRRRIEQAWGARVVDHAGASEVGPWGYGDRYGRDLRVLESEFIAEFLTLRDERPAESGETSQLVLTALGRRGMPIIRYRTGDLVQPYLATTSNAASLGGVSQDVGQSDCQFTRLRGGVLGRADDMLIVRGVNVFPSSIDEIVRSFPEVTEYRATVRKRGNMDELLLEVEDALSHPARIAEAFAVRLGLKVDVQCVAPKSLPRFEGKAKRVVEARVCKS